MISPHDRVWRTITFQHLWLFPAALIFALLSATRRALYRCGLLAAQRVPAFVVVVGNISVGGTGKTPLSRWLIESLQKLGIKPGVVSRGYGGNAAGPLEVRPDSDPEVVGDEPILLAQANVPVWVGRDRVAAARELLARHPECDLIISDDGLQHYRLARDFEIAVIDGSRLFGNGLLLPAGPLREPVSRLKSVDAVVLNSPEKSLELATPAKVYPMRFEGEIFRQLLHPEIAACATEFAGKRIHAIAGIGNPERFFGTLRRLGIDSVNHAFADHHAFASGDLDFPDCDIVIMTEKDAVKCRRFAHQNCWVLPVQAHIDPELARLIVDKKRKCHGSEAA